MASCDGCKWMKEYPTFPIAKEKEPWGWAINTYVCTNPQAPDGRCDIFGEFTRTRLKDWVNGDDGCAYWERSFFKPWKLRYDRNCDVNATTTKQIDLEAKWFARFATIGIALIVWGVLLLF